MKANTWTLAEAQTELGEVIKRARSRGPQTIVRDGRRVAVVVSAEKRKGETKRVGNLAEFFAASPLRGSGIVIERMKDRPSQMDRHDASDAEPLVHPVFNPWE
jgi:prevent-host-death family protein